MYPYFQALKPHSIVESFPKLPKDSSSNLPTSSANGGRPAVNFLQRKNMLCENLYRICCSAVLKLHVAGTMQNIAFPLFTLHVAHNLSSFFTT